ncbi:MAG: FtsX-like permease family protein [Vicinamibacterales bacterium]|nr:FtsX-like permease family protein [Vicinamibacterales bacterium]
MTRAWHVAWRSLGRNRRRNLATATAILLGYAGLVLIGGYVVRIERFLRTNAVYLGPSGHVVVYREGGLERAASRPSRYSLSPGHQAAIAEVLRADARVEFFGRYLRGQGLAGNGCRTLPFEATGVEPEVEARVLAHPVVRREAADFARPLRGRLVSQSADVEGAVGLSAGLAEMLGKPRVHDEVGRLDAFVVPVCDSDEAKAQIAADANVQLAALTFDGSLGAVDGEVVNVFHTPSSNTEDQTVVTSLALLQQLYDTEDVTFVAAFLHEAGEADAVAGDLRGALAARGVPAEVFTYRDYDVNPYYAGTMQFLGSLVTIIGVLVITVVVLGVVNAATLTVYERTREMGTFRALGYTRRQVSALLVREMLLLSLVAMAAGLVLAFGVAAAVNASDIRFSPPGVPGSVQLTVTPNLAIAAVVALAMLPLSLLATWAVARRRVRERVADLLTATTA